MTVTVDAPSDSARLVVADTGGGIPSEELPHLFERFWRGPNAEAATGSGIGLAIVDELVTAHHGQVKAQSTLGHGAVFTVLLPLAAPEVLATSPGSRDSG